MVFYVYHKKWGDIHTWPLLKFKAQILEILILGAIENHLNLAVNRLILLVE